MGGKRSLLAILTLVLIAVVVAGYLDVVQAGTHPVGSVVESRIIRFIEDIYPEGNPVRIKLNSIPAALRENVAVVNVNFVNVPDVNGNGICSVEIKNRAGRVRVVQVPFRVFSKRELFVLKKAGQKGDLVSMKDIRVRETYMNGRQGGYPASAEDVVGKALKRDVPANTVITDQVLENQVVMKRGDIVTIIAETNKLIVRAKGRTIDKGGIGETIRVRNIASGKELTAKVMSGSTVKVEF